MIPSVPPVAMIIFTQHLFCFATMKSGEGHTDDIRSQPEVIVSRPNGSIGSSIVVINSIFYAFIKTYLAYNNLMKGSPQSGQIMLLYS